MKGTNAVAWFFLARAGLVILAAVGLYLVLTGAFNDPQWLAVKQGIAGYALALALYALLVWWGKAKIAKHASDKQTPKDCQGVQVKQTPYQ